MGSGQGYLHLLQLRHSKHKRGLNRRQYPDDVLLMNEFIHNRFLTPSQKAKIVTKRFIYFDLRELRDGISNS